MGKEVYIPTNLANAARAEIYAIAKEKGTDELWPSEIKKAMRKAGVFAPVEAFCKHEQDRGYMIGIGEEDERWAITRMGFAAYRRIYEAKNGIVRKAQAFKKDVEVIYGMLMSVGGEDGFTANEIASLTGFDERVVKKALSVLEKDGRAKKNGKKGRSTLWVGVGALKLF